MHLAGMYMRISQEVLQLEAASHSSAAAPACCLCRRPGSSPATARGAAAPRPPGMHKPCSQGLALAPALTACVAHTVPTPTEAREAGVATLLPHTGGAGSTWGQAMGEHIGNEHTVAGAVRMSRQPEFFRCAPPDNAFSTAGTARLQTAPAPAPARPPWRCLWRRCCRHRSARRCSWCLCWRPCGRRLRRQSQC